MPWEVMETKEDLQKMLEDSSNKAYLLLKHSTRCSISHLIKKRLESNWDLTEEEIIPVYLDLLAHRPLSNDIEKELNIRHESPQVIVLRGGEVIYHASHSAISLDAIKNAL
ncbi:MAG: bacillithiol system redox-active protein YtxJ [Crocinitomicaceae bacterium]|nr:bacillithiol system redox-active protein YtxJ [Crocinitomicaceae bacterium]